MIDDVCVQRIIEERTVVAAKLDRGGRPQSSFRLPLRTRIELHFHGRWKKSVDAPSYSRWDSVAEEVSKAVYHTVTGHRSALFSRLCPSRVLYLHLVILFI